MVCLDGFMFVYEALMYGLDWIGFEEDRYTRTHAAGDRQEMEIPEVVFYLAYEQTDMDT